MLLTWDAPAQHADSVTGYRILRRNPDRYAYLGIRERNTGSTDTTFTDTSVGNNTRYAYRVQALRGNEVSARSNSAILRYRRPATATPTATPTPTPTATATSTPTPTATATPRSVNRRSVPPPRLEKVTPTPETVDPPISERQVSEEPRILVENEYSSTLGTLLSGDVHAQGFTTGTAASRLTGVVIYAFPRSAARNLSLSISKATTSGQPGSTLYSLITPTNIQSSLSELDVLFTAPEDASLEANTQYFIHLTTTATIDLGHASSSAESASSLAGWSISDNSQSYDGSTWAAADSARVYVITVMGVAEDEAEPDRESTQTSSAISLGYSRAAGESPYVSASIDDTDDIDWFTTGLLSIDAGARYRIDIRPSSVADSRGLRVRAFYAEYRPLRSEDVFVELERLDGPVAGVYSYYVTPTKQSGPYIEVYDLLGTTADYEIRFVNDPDMTWNGTEVLSNDLPHDDTTWATVVVDDGSHELGVYNYYDDHDWFKAEFEAGVTYIMLTGPPDDRVFTPDIGTVIRLYDSEGNQLAIGYGNSRVVINELTYTVPAGEGGTYFVDVSYANFQDDPDALALLGLTQGFETDSSPFISSRYKLQVKIKSDGD